MMALASSMGMLAVISSCAFADDIEVGADGGFVDGEDELYGEDELQAEDEDLPAAEVSAEEAFDIDNRPWLSVEKVRQGRQLAGSQQRGWRGAVRHMLCPYIHAIRVRIRYHDL